jgi:hypothetical protein
MSTSLTPVRKDQELPVRKDQELRSVIDSIEIVSPTEFLFHNLGEYLTSDGHIQNIIMAKEESNIYQFAELHNILYSLLHCRQDLSLYYRTRNIDEYDDIQQLTRLLSEANSGEGTWDPDWEIVKIERNGQEFAVKKDGLILWVFPNEIFVREGPAEVGKKSYIKIGKEFRELTPGSYSALGNATFDESQGIEVRIYWNITAGGAVPLMKKLTKEMNSIDMPFRFKILKNPHSFSRVDAAVLYINKQHLRSSRDSLSKVYQSVLTHLSYPTPLFAKELAPGLSLAESPYGIESFGEHRCRIFAEAIHYTYKYGARSLDMKVSQVMKYFFSLGIDLNRAYLNPNSVDDYDVLLKGAFN